MLLPLAVFAGFAALAYVALQRENPDALPSALAGKEVPPVELTQLGPEKPFTDSDLRAKGVKLVNIWASWCAPCRAEHPTLTKLAQQGIPIYGINYKDDPDKALKFLEELGNPYRAIGADPAGRMALNWGAYGVPETFVIDSDGRIVTRFAGPVTARVLETTLGPAIEAAK